MIEKTKMLCSGKTKSLYETNMPNLLVAEFRDDTTAFDGAKYEKLNRKGMVNNLINAHLMGILSDSEIPTHFETIYSDHESLIKRLNMIPIECVVRNIAAGSLCRRLGIQEGITLHTPLFELFLKNDDLHDPLITEDHANAFGWATPRQLKRMRELSLKIHKILTSVLGRSNLILVDAKYEFGLQNNVIVLGDEISPDSCRIWDAQTKTVLDKDRFRKDMGQVVESYEFIAHRLGLELPVS